MNTNSEPTPRISARFATTKKKIANAKKPKPAKDEWIIGDTRKSNSQKWSDYQINIYDNRGHVIITVHGATPEEAESIAKQIVEEEHIRRVEYPESMAQMQACISRRDEENQNLRLELEQTKVDEQKWKATLQSFSQLKLLNVVKYMGMKKELTQARAKIEELEIYIERSKII